MISQPTKGSEFIQYTKSPSHTWRNTYQINSWFRGRNHSLGTQAGVFFALSPLNYACGTQGRSRRSTRMWRSTN